MLRSTSRKSVRGFGNDDGPEDRPVFYCPQCAECGEVWLPADDDRWRAYLDTEDELVFYCPACAEGEFD